MPTFYLPVFTQAGERRLVGLNASLRVEVLNQAGTPIEITNSPDQTPPNGQFPVTLRGGGVALIPFYASYGSSMDITTVARVKTQLTGISGTSEDAFIQEVITGLSGYFERYMRRVLLKQTYTKQHYVRRWKQIVSLDAFPIESVTSIKYCENPSGFSTATAMDASSYAILEDGTTGVIMFLREMPLAPGFLQIVFVGGMAEDQAELELNYPELVQAADMQCVHEFNRRFSPGGNVTFGGGSTSFDFSSVELIPRVKGVLDTFRRHYIGA